MRRGRRDCRNALKLLLSALGIAISQMAVSQDSTPLLRLQETRATLDIDSNAEHGRGMYGITYGNPGDVWTYPNSSSCLVVYGDGKYVLEKRDEQTVGRPKIKSAEGMLAGDDLQQLKVILDAEEFKKLITPKPPELPSDARAVREVHTLDLQIDRSGNEQSFSTMQERVITGGTSIGSGPSTGLDTFLDNGTPYKKTLSPLMKWFEGLEKKNKSTLKESKPQYCAPVNIS